jgi:hypothetical protein
MIAIILKITYFKLYMYMHMNCVSYLFVTAKNYIRKISLKRGGVGWRHVSGGRAFA